MKTWLRRLGIGAGGLLTLLAVLVAAAWGISERKFARSWVVEASTVPTSADPLTIARGRHLATAVAKCVDCHGPDLGGVTMIDDGAMGRLASANLTRGTGGIGATYSDADWVRAVRHGVNKAGKAMLIMPSAEYSRLSDADLGAIISYIKTVPAVDRVAPTRKINLVPRVLLTAGIFPPLGAEVIDHAAVKTVGAPSPGVTKEYGRYLADIGGCTGCHGPSLSGGASGEPGSPPAKNLTPKALGSWTEADFFRALREGKRPDGTAISESMPWKASGKMTDDEIRAVWAYLQSVPPKEFKEQ